MQTEANGTGARTLVDDLFHAVVDLSTEERNRHFTEHEIQPDLRREVEHLVAFDASPSCPIDTNIGQVAEWTLERFEWKGARCGPYRLRTLVGRGGMGSVYAAERVDGEVTQRAAVKILQPGADIPALRRRFLGERQILASLSHPNVAKLLDAGHREDGQPYLVMEYIDGETIDAYTAGLSVRQSVALFLKDCDAVSYLHRNLVVHRDLKPSNILVTSDGEPKLLDFGIAKMLDLASDSTLTGMRMATPEYASPEQVAGGPITTATDIYSLGAVLYRILTGEPPRHSGGDSAKAVALAISGSPLTPPSKLAPHVKRDLEIVLMKALRAEPEQRYASVDALASDLRAFLQHQPVQARSGDVWYRARNLLRRHWVSAAVTAFVIASLSAGLCIANRERKIAERRFGELRQLSSKVIELDRSIRTLPGSMQARQRLVAVSLQYLEGISQEARGDLELSQEISDGYWRMARIQGVNAEFNLGDRVNAQANLKKADALIETILASRPRDRNALFRSALIAHDLMIIADDERRSDVPVYAGKVVERLEAFLRQDDPRSPVRLDGFLQPGDARQAELRGAATLLANVALAYVNRRCFEEGAQYARRAAELVQPIPSAQDTTSAALSVLANALRYEGRLDEALLIIVKARELSERAVYPNETARVLSQYGPLLRHGRILGERDAVSLGRPAEAAAILQKALDMNEELARKDAADSASRGRIATTARELGDILRDRGPQRALAVYELGIQRSQETPGKTARRERAELLAKSSYALRRLHRAAEAQTRIDAALEILRELGEYPAARIGLGGPLYSVVRAQADHEADAGNARQAVGIYDELLRKAPDADPNANLQDAARVSQILGAMAGLNQRIGRRDVAWQMASRRVDLWMHWYGKLPNNSYVRQQLEAANRSISLNLD